MTIPTYIYVNIGGSYNLNIEMKDVFHVGWQLSQQCVESPILFTVQFNLIMEDKARGNSTLNLLIV